MKKQFLKGMAIALLAMGQPAVKVLAQDNLVLPQASQKASVSQTIGLTDIWIDYHSPLVNDRKVWGTLVPYNEVWRCGANENTVISFSTDVMIEGKPLAAGVYGLHMIPSEKQWTIIFSKDHDAWGSYFYKKENDVLRVNIMPVSMNESQNWLSFAFSDIQATAASIDLRWEKLKVSFKVEVDVKNAVLASIRKQLTGLAGFNWQAYNQAANYCLANNFNLDEALVWTNLSIEQEENFGTLMTKSWLLAKKGNTVEADVLAKKALPLANEQQLNVYGYQLIGQKKTAEALEVFKTNAKQHPNSWNVYDSLGEAYNAAGNKKEAISTYKLALAKAPKEQQSRIQGTIKSLEESK